MNFINSLNQQHTEHANKLKSESAPNITVHILDPFVLNTILQMGKYHSEKSLYSNDWMV